MIILLFLLFVLIYPVTPFVEDLRTFFSAAHQAELTGLRFPINVYRAWELKLIGNRIFIFALYKLATTMVDFSNKLMFEVIVRSIYCLLFIGASYYFSRSLLKGRKFKYFFLIVAIAFLAAGGRMNIQSEEIALLLAILGGSMSLSSTKLIRFFSGVFFAYSFTLKGVSGAISVQMLLLLALLGTNKKKVKDAIISSIFFGLLFLAGFIFLFPNEIQAMYELAVYKSLAFQGRSWFKFGYMMIVSFFMWSWQHPYLMVASLLGTVQLAYWLLESKWMKLLEIGLLWLPGIMAIALQARNFPYDVYFHIIPISYLGYYCIRKLITKGVNRKMLISLMVILVGVMLLALFWGQTYYKLYFYMLVWWLIGLSILLSKKIRLGRIVIIILFGVLLSFSFGFMNDEYRWKHLEQRTTLESLFANLDKTIENDHSSILYLASGDASYFLGMKSHCEQTEPHAVQRGREYSKKSLPNFQEQMNCVLGYKGKYILMDSWFNISDLEKVRSKLLNEYGLITLKSTKYRSMKLYKRK